MVEETAASVNRGLWLQLTEKARKAALAAEDRAIARGDVYVTDVHLLLGLLADTENLACRLITEQDISLEALQSRLEAFLSEGGSPAKVPPTVTPRVKQVFELAAREARRAQCRYIGTEHLL